MTRSIYLIGLWLVPTFVWVWIFDHVRLPKEVAPYVFGMILECRYENIQRIP